MSQPDIIELELPICQSASERPGTEVLDVERVGPNRYRLVYSPGVSKVKVFCAVMAAFVPHPEELRQRRLEG